jgi:PAS domain S-box-containing protein
VAQEEPTFVDVAEALALGVPYRVHVSADGLAMRLLSIGRACEAVFGLSAEALMADPWRFAEFILPPDRDALLREGASSLAERRPRTSEVRMRAADGVVRWVRLTATPRWLEDGSSEWTGLAVDITASKRMAEQLAEDRRRLELAVELCGVGVFEWDRDDPDAMRWSDHQYAIYGVPPQTPMTVKAFRGLIHPEDREQAYWARRWAADAPDEADRSGEYRIVRPDGEIRWVLSHQRVRRDARGVRSIHGTTVDITDRRNAEEQRRLQMRELAHRSKNAIAVMMALVQQAARGATSVEDVTTVIISRLDAMARSQELAAASEGGPQPLHQLLRRALEAFDIARFELDPELEPETVPAEAVVPIALIMHELATNAVKYGALSAREGRVRVSRTAAPEGALGFEWRERGGPPVVPPEREGFGMRLLATALKGVGGDVEPRFEQAGFSARMVMLAR